MKVWFDTEFIEDGKTIDLISIGAVREDGATFYRENINCDLSRAVPWVQANVVPKLVGGLYRATRENIARDFWEFNNSSRPEFWAYYGAYDWVALCQLYGTMMDLPEGWPYYACDLKQWQETIGGNLTLPKQTTPEHHALNDAIWTREAWEWVKRYAPIGSRGLV